METLIKRMKRLIKKPLTPFFYFFATRENGMKHELKFWEKWIRTEGGEWPEDFKYRLDPKSMVTGYHGKILDKISSNKILALDVGAGPVTCMGKKHINKELVLFACDPLADEYNRILAKYSIISPVKTEKCDGECLSDLYKTGYFDWVNAQNCVDHAYDPVKVITEIIKVTKKGGYITLLHAANEARNEAYRGLHQWNFSEEKGDFIISGKQGFKRNITKEFENEVEISTWIEDDGWMHVIGRKRVQ